ncbi:MAG TPA: ParB/RepB/Spo0J family partition protein [Candidatus Acidoferrales bacterium]|nr:ParB/RepB/Spo0J family partition protein [Candidatus Acidoferrales bacterium]
MKTQSRTAPHRGRPAPASSSIAPNPRFEELAPELLDEPRISARQTFDQEKLDELCESIRFFGRVLEPLIVEREGARYRIHAGHRRWHAAKLVGLAVLPCMVYDAGTVPGEAVKSHENSVREELNCAEEAIYFRQLLEGPCENDVDRLAAMVHQKPQYVQQRLALILGDANVFEGLKAGVISIGVAQELNLVRSPGYRLQYLTVAAQGGCSVRQMRDWRIAANAMPETLVPPGGAPMPEGQPPPPPPNSHPECIFCRSDEDQHEMAVLFAHRSCMRAAERKGVNNG